MAKGWSRGDRGKELPAVVWGLRNTSLLILSNKKKKKSHSLLDGFWLFLAPISREGREGTGGRLSPVFVFLLVLSLSVGLGEDRVGLTWDRTSKLLWSRSLYADCLACVCRMGELSSSVWAGDLLFPSWQGQAWSNRRALRELGQDGPHVEAGYSNLGC